MITDEQYGALKRIVEDVKKYYAELSKDFPRVMGNDVQLAERFLKSQADRHDRIERSWHIEDVRSLEEQSEAYGSEKFEPLTDEECREVLKRVDDGHDATIGINWDVLQYHLDEVREERKFR